MTRLGLEFHHLGLAVALPDDALQFLVELGYHSSERVFDPQQGVNLILCHHATSPDVELIYPGNSNGPLDSILKGRDSHIYHMCFECESIQGTLSYLKEKKYRVLLASPPKSAILFGGRNVGFYFVKGFGLIELLERAATIPDISRIS